MSNIRKRRRPPRTAQALQAKAQPAAQANPGGAVAKKTKTGKKYVKRHRVAKGDIVQIHSGMNNYTGLVVEVVGYLSKNEVLVRAFPNDSDIPSFLFTVDPREWDLQTGVGPHGYNAYYALFIKRVIRRATPKPKKPKAKRTVHLLETHEDVLAALRGDTEIDPKAAVVVAIPDPAAQTTEETA